MPHTSGHTVRAASTRLQTVCCSETDIHRLFDLGYVTVSGDSRFEVGRRLREDFENGKYYYAMHGQPVFWPINPEQQPKRELLEWHQTNSFLG
jgi:putative restriction endonuclease